MMVAAKISWIEVATALWTSEPTGCIVFQARPKSPRTKSPSHMR